MTAVGVQQMSVNAFQYLLDEEAHGDLQATDAVFLTFNVDLGFFEARLLGVCQASGARVTVVADMSVWAPDPRSVKHAGRAYHIGLFDTRHAFHPKVLLLVGPKRAVAAVGSGNLTLGGWQYNAELLTVFTGDSEQMPTAFGDLRDALASLTAQGGIDSLATNGLRRTVEQLDALLDTATPVDTGHRLAASWDGPLIDLLPTEPVDELLLTAPFYDDHAEAVRRVLTRLRPRTVRIVVQPGWTAVEPDALQKVLDTYRDSARTDAVIEVFEDAENRNTKKGRYRHGKLIEWVTDTGERFALTGSPNLSGVALLKSVADGGNHEVAVLSPINETLFPTGTAITVSDLPPNPVTADVEPETDDDFTVPGLSAAVRTETGIRLYLTRPVTGPVTVESTSASGDWSKTSPDAWETVTALRPAPAVTDYDLPHPMTGGSRLRLTGTGPDGTVWVSQPVFLADPNRVLRRPGVVNQQARSKNTTALDLFADDPAALRALENDLAALADELTHLQPTAVPKPTTNAPAAPVKPAEGPEPWLWLQDETARHIGPGLTSYALGLPTLPTGDLTDIAWDDRLTDETDVGLATDTSDNIEAQEHDTDNDEPDLGAALEETGLEPVDHTQSPQRIKTARTTWVRRMTDLAPRLPIQFRLLALRLALTYWSAGDWKPGDIEPLHLTARLTRSLDTPGTTPELEERVGSLTAVALTMLRLHADLDTHNAESLLYRDTTNEVQHLVLAATPDLVTEYVQRLTSDHRTPLAADTVLEVATNVTSDDPLVDLVRSLERDGHDITRINDRTVRIDGTFSNPTHIALDAVGQAEDTGNLAAWAINDTGYWSLVAWIEPDLITVSHNRYGTRWRHQRLPGVIGPAAIAATYRIDGTSTDYSIETKPKHQPTDTARAILTHFGISDPEPQ